MQTEESLESIGIGLRSPDREIVAMPQATDSYRTPELPENVRRLTDSEDLQDNLDRPEPDDEVAIRLEDWLTHVGLRFNPFAPNILHAEEDARLSTYLVGHDDFAAVWGDWISTVLAARGGGKSAFRVRLAYVSRIGEDGRRVFPIVHALPRAASTLDAHLDKLTRSAAFELLLEMAYRPSRFEALDEETRRQVRNAFDHNAPGWERFLPQLKRAGGPAPLAATFDRSAMRLPNPPDPERVRAMCSALEQLPRDPQRLSSRQRWEQLAQLLMDKLQIEAIYILVDNLDILLKKSDSLQQTLAQLSPLLDQARTWAEAHIFLKLFLPVELYDTLWETYPHLLTFPAKFAKIDWDSNRLAKVLAARIQAASDGEFGSLDALCSPALRDLDHELAGMARPAIPREALMLAGRLLVEHARRPDAGDLLEPEDLEAAKEWYRVDRQTIDSS